MDEIPIPNKSLDNTHSNKGITNENSIVASDDVVNLLKTTSLLQSKDKATVTGRNYDSGDSKNSSGLSSKFKSMNESNQAFL
jgi:hypothetical protein